MWQDVVPEKWRADYRSRFEGTVDPILGELAKAGRSSENLAGKGSTDPLFNPLLHPNLRDLPPAYLQVAGLDPLRDEALIYEHVLREENGVQTKMDVYDGYGHM
jgi:acetyl esterase/lipase